MTTCSRKSYINDVFSGNYLYDFARIELKEIIVEDTTDA